MLKMTNKHVLLLLILALSFTYRMLLMLWATYPPGADIGLHNSVIYSITQGGNTNFLWNNYQMGGGQSLTFPGYHIFVSYIIMLTSMPDYLAHTIAVSFFSTMIAACAFLIARAAWNESTAFIAAFLVAISRFDVEMLLWGGFPNVVTLVLIPVVFYLFLKRERFSLLPFLVTTTILSGTIYLTHSLSAVMFIGMVFLTVVVGVIFSRGIGVSKKRILVSLLPVFLGGVLVSPFLIDAVPAYLSANSSGLTDIKQALLSTRVLPLEYVVPLFLCVGFFFLFSRYYKGKYLTIPALLLTVWILVPMVFTQGYLVGLYIDYNRFLYFVLLPLLVLIALGIDHGTDFFSRVIATYVSFATEKIQTNKTVVKLKPHLSRKNIYSVLLLAFLLIAFIFVPILLTPTQGVVVQTFYQVMTDPGYEAIQWARLNTPPGSIFISDALYGWWFSGFAQRPTISAVDPQYLTLSREYEPAKAAKNLMDTDYVIDNGLIQVREDGGYIGRHNPMFLGKLNWTYFPYPFFNFDNDDVTIELRDGDDVRLFDLSELSVLEMKLLSNTNVAEVAVVKGNSFVNFTQVLTVYQGRKFVNMTVTIESDLEEVSLLALHSILHIRGTPIIRTDTVGLFEEGSKVLGQVIYAENRPEQVKIITPQNPSGLEFVYNLHGESSAELQLFLSAFSVSDLQSVYQDTVIWENPYLNGLMDENLKTYLVPNTDESKDFPLDTFDYIKATVDWNISYIAVRGSGLLPKFARDPAFSTVFINDEVAIFMVKRSFT